MTDALTVTFDNGKLTFYRYGAVLHEFYIDFVGVMAAISF